MYIAPNTTIRILKNCPLDNNYEHTIFFQNATQQTNYFSSLTKYSQIKYTYQRYNKGEIKVELPTDNLYDCNYIMFQNTNFGSKWFYAFIKAVEYVSNNVSTIYYEMDVMQTWLFETNVGECYVEREHSSTDAIGDNLVPENLETGPYITTATTELTIDVEDIGYILMATEKIPDYPMSVGNLSGLYNMCWYQTFNHIGKAYDQFGEITYDYYLDQLIGEYSSAGKSDAIICCYAFCKNKNIMGDLMWLVEPVEHNCAPRTITGYVPKNNKLYTYPYCCLVLHSPTNMCELRYELFSGTPKFITMGSYLPNGNICALPKNYAGYNYDYTNTVSLGTFPKIAWVNNYYQNWIAQNSGIIKQSALNSLITSTIGTASGVANAVVSGVSGSPMGVSRSVSSAANSLVGGYTSVASTLAQVEKQKILPDTLGGSVMAGDTVLMSGNSGIRTYCRTLKPEFLKIIDNYFTRFGYATHKLKKPNRDVRAHWTFTKTVNATITGSVPADVLRDIENIYNRGITFWRNGAEIGNYSLNNTISIR